MVPVLARLSIPGVYGSGAKLTLFPVETQPNGRGKFLTRWEFGASGDRLTETLRRYADFLI